jgi:hypothetical protein
MIDADFAKKSLQLLAAKEVNCVACNGRTKPRVIGDSCLAEQGRGHAVGIVCFYAGTNQVVALVCPRIARKQREN